MGTGGSFPRGKVQVHGADQSPPASTKVKNAWSYNSTPLVCLHGVALVKHRDNFAFTFMEEYKSASCPGLFSPQEGGPSTYGI